MAIFAGGPSNLMGIKYFDLLFFHSHLLIKPKICAKFERNWWFELYRLLPGSAWFSRGHTLKNKQRYDINIVSRSRIRAPCRYMKGEI